MKATLEFDLDNLDDREAHLRAIKATEMAIFIWDFVYNGMRAIEHEVENHPDNYKDPYEMIELFRKTIMEELEDKNININELVS